MSERELLKERYDLVLERIRQIPEEQSGEEGLKKYFDRTASFLLLLDDTERFLEEGGLRTASLEELAERNHALYEDVLPEHYDKSYGNPVYAVEMLGEYGQELSWLYVELRRQIGCLYEGETEQVVAGMELFVEIYGVFACAWNEDRRLPSGDEIRRIIYWYVCDYQELRREREIRQMVCPDACAGTELIENGDLGDVRYLYAYGRYVSENELETARYLSSLPEETIATMADTYTEGYRMGFEVTGKDLSKKKTVEIRYHMGFERMVRRAIQNFAGMGLRPVMRSDFLEGGTVNRQYSYDHRDDRALFLDRTYIKRSMEAATAAFEKYRKEAAGYAGPAVIETFGQKEFDPVNKKEALRLSDEQNRLSVDFMAQYRALTQEYIKAEERSFTIIAFPIPEVGPVFRELFDETIRLNTLDYMLYRDVQQKLIDALDTADYCEVKGCGDNRTDLKVNLWKLKNPETETIFENCVADVNIPVGEVFTSPVLEGTNGILHVTRVFLNGLEYRDLSLTFEDGMIKDYTCGNFDTEEENRNFVKENILFRRETLPLGEFAIGTNTTAYCMAKRLDVEAKLPILIAEKTGPHFAVGDTCYDHTEDVQVYNPDGKEIVAKENVRSALRGTKPEEAYFNCHTDITIPYDELGELTAVQKDGGRIPIIRNGRFVLPGTEPLNEAFESIPGGGIH